MKALICNICYWVTVRLICLMIILITLLAALISGLICLPALAYLRLKNYFKQCDHYGND